MAFFEHMFIVEVGGFNLSRLKCVPQLVSHEDNALLTNVPKEAETKAVVFQMDSSSAAGPDGFSFVFYKVC